MDLVNIDFSRPGSWNQRCGSTQYISTGLTQRILGLNEYERLDGYSSIIVNTNTSAYYASGTSFYQLFLTAGGISKGITFTSGSTFVVFTGASPIVNSFDNNIFDYTTFLNTELFSNGSSGSFFKYNPETAPQGYRGFSGLPQYKFAYKYSLPGGKDYAQENQTYGQTYFLSSTGVTLAGNFKLGFGFLDMFGYRSSPTLIDATGFSIVGGSLVQQFMIQIGVSIIPWDYGFTAISVYSTNANGSQLFLLGDFALGNLNPTIQTTRQSFETTNFGASQFILGVDTFIFDVNSATYITKFPLSDPAQFPLFLTLAPRYMEIYNNQVYMAGFTTQIEPALPFTPPYATLTINFQSQLFWTEVGTLEFIDPTFFAEVRTNDGDRITGLKFYQNTLLITKQRSFHRLTAQSATDITIQQVSDQYGCLSNQTIITYNQQCLFLDRKGIVRWDGANISMASNKIEPIFQRLNVPAAIDNAVGIHYKSRNECWFAVPVDGATLNNLIIVYDYFSDAWTTYSGPIPSYLTQAKGRLNTYEGLYGGYSGSIFNFGATLTSDNGQAITLSISTLFYRDLGNSVEKQFRRLFMDVDPFTPGSTVTINMYQDHGSSLILTRYMPVGTFQNRIDFGIPAKSLQFQMSYANASLPIRINGITVESRYQRSV